MLIFGLCTIFLIPPNPYVGISGQSASGTSSTRAGNPSHPP